MTIDEQNRTVGYIGGSWASNIGNSFYNLGAIWFLKEIFGEDNVFFIPDSPIINHQKNSSRLSLGVIRKV